MSHMFDCVIEIAGIPIDVFTHACPHADELNVIFLLENVGTKDFVEKYCPDRKLYLGIGGGYFDDHVKGREKKSCLLLVVEALGMDVKDERWRWIIRFVDMNDVNGRKDPRDIAALLKQMMQQNPEGQYDHAQWFMNGLLIKYYDDTNKDFTIDRIALFGENIPHLEFDLVKWKEKGEKAYQLRQDFYDNAVTEFEEKFAKGEVYETTIKKGEKILKVFKVYSSNYMMSAVLRSKHDAGVVFIRNDKGYILISVRQNEVVNGTEEVSAVLRYKEQFSNGKIVQRDWKVLREDFTLAEVPEWHFVSKTKMIMNGGITHPDTPRTKLSDDEILEAIKIGLSEDFWNGCEGGCKRCAWNKFGLSRCRSKRFAATAKK